MGVASRHSGHCPYPERKEDEGQQEVRHDRGVKCVVRAEAKSGSLGEAHSPSFRPPVLELTLLGQIPNWAFYYFYHTRDAQEQRCSRVSVEVSQPQCFRKKKKQSKSKHSLMPRLSSEEGSSLEELVGPAFLHSPQAGRGVGERRPECHHHSGSLQRPHSRLPSKGTWKPGCQALISPLQPVRQGCCGPLLSSSPRGQGRHTRLVSHEVCRGTGKGRSRKSRGAVGSRPLPGHSY